MNTAFDVLDIIVEQLPKFIKVFDLRGLLFVYKNVINLRIFYQFILKCYFAKLIILLYKLSYVNEGAHMFFHYAYFSRIFIFLCFYGCNCVDVQRFRVSLYHIDGLYK